MSVVKINVLTVPEHMRDTLEERFANRAGEVDKVPGFLFFELLRPNDGSDRYFVLTKWESEEAFQGWVSSQAFTKGHAQSAGEGSSQGSHPGGGHPGGEGHGGGHGGGEGGPPKGGPAATGAELLSFDVILESSAKA